MKIRQGDTVLVISGKDKGKSGTVERVLPKDGRVIVAGINMRTRHIKKTAQEAGRKIRYEAGIAIGKVMIIDPKTKKPTRVGFQIKDGKKMRITKLSGVEVVKAKAKVEKKLKKTDKKGADVVAAAGSEPAEQGMKDAAPKKQPFWRRNKGAAVAQTGEVAEPAHMEKDQSIPSQEMHVRKGGRGS